MKKKIFSIALLGLLSTLSADVISKNGIAKDSATGLEWQDEPYTQAEKTAYDKSTNSGKAGNWQYAKAYCENLTLGGKSDWRLPNIYELTTLLDNTKSSEPYVIDAIENIASSYYWSSTTYASDSSGAWGVGFSNGYDGWVFKTDSNYVRCVRAGQLNFDNLVILKNKGKLKVSQENMDKISPNAEKIKAQKEAERKKKEAQESAEIEKQAEYDRKNACSGLYPGKNIQVYTSGLLRSGYDEGRITGVDKEGGQVSFEWKRGSGDWKSEETTCSYLKTQMK